MNRNIYITIVALSTTIFMNCSILHPTQSVRYSKIKEYSYFYIAQDNHLTSNQISEALKLSYSITKTDRQSELITEVLLKKGLIRIHQPQQKLLDKTLIVNYGQSNQRLLVTGNHIQEISIQLVDAHSQSIVFSCSAEEDGDTDDEDIVFAI